MPRAILSKQALHTLTQLHAELAGKIETNRKGGLDPDFKSGPCPPIPQHGQPVVQTRDARQSRHRHAQAVSGAHDDAGDSGRALGREEA
jgi:hypothetical protein